MQVSPPPVRRADAPAGQMRRSQTWKLRGDTLRSEKSYLDALDYYRAALAKEPDSARLYNKIGINELQMAALRRSPQGLRARHQESTGSSPTPTTIWA